MTWQEARPNVKDLRSLFVMNCCAQIVTRLHVPVNSEQAAQAGRTKAARDKYSVHTSNAITYKVLHSFW